VNPTIWTEALHYNLVKNSVVFFDEENDESELENKIDSMGVGDVLLEQTPAS
jgi:hypothetical protein